ncbi:MAG: TonB-dependent receptor [Pseudomonadota bacterium]
MRERWGRAKSSLLLGAAIFGLSSVGAKAQPGAQVIFVDDEGGLTGFEETDDAIVFDVVRVKGRTVGPVFFGDYFLGSTPATASYLNNTPIFVSLAPLDFGNFARSAGGLLDIDSVDVFSTPQSSRLGAESLNGAVLYTQREAQLGEFEGRFSGSLSNTEGSESLGYTVGGFVNVPVGDKAALRANVYLQDFPGVVDYVNLYTLDGSGIPVAPNGILDDGFDSAVYRSVADQDDFESLYGRLNFYWAPRDDIEISINYHYQDDESGGFRQPTVGVDGLGEAYGELERGAVIAEPSDRELHLVSLEGEVDFGFATLTSSTSYHENEGARINDSTGFFANNLAVDFALDSDLNGTNDLFFPRPLYQTTRTFEDTSFVQEFRLTDDEGPLKYVAGVFFRDQERSLLQQSDLPGYEAWADAQAAFFMVDDFVFSDNVFTFDRTENYQEISLYGDVSYNLTPALEFRGGVKWVDIDSDVDTAVRTGVSDIGFSEGASSFTNDADDVQFNAGISYALQSNLQLYTTYSEGFRRGGSNGVSTEGIFVNADGFASFSPDTTKNYDVGVRGTIGAVQFDLRGYFEDWDNPQFITSTVEGVLSAIVNGEEARTHGAVAAFNGALFNDRVHYGVQYTYTDAELSEDLVLPPIFEGDTGQLLAPSGSRLPFISDHTIDFAFDYQRPLGDFFFITRLDGAYQSSRQNLFDPLFESTTVFDGFATVDLSFTLAAGNWNTTLFIQNVTDSDGVLGGVDDSFGPVADAEFFGSNVGRFIINPRTVGIALNYNF